jgi:hypothetical protein
MLRPISIDALAALDRPSMIVLADTSVLSARSEAGEPDPVVTSLASYGVPLILASTMSARSMAEWQRALRIRHPFISDSGAALHIPGGYFEALLGFQSVTDDWHVVEVARSGPDPSFTTAIRVLLGLFWTRRSDGLVVAVTDRHRDLLTAADVPIIVRNPVLDQRDLRRCVPAAYVTNATGCAGWAEGILGSLTE